jgi:hypothetical protein
VSLWASHCVTTDGFSEPASQQLDLQIYVKFNKYFGEREQEFLHDFMDPTAYGEGIPNSKQANRSASDPNS